MSEAVSAQLHRMEGLLLELSSKIDNYMGLAELSPEELEELDEIETEMAAGDCATFDEVFKDD